MEFGRCYAAAVNASDLMVRWGARSVPNLREGTHGRAGVKGIQKGGRCGGRWTDTFLKSDILLAQSGHWPHRCFADEVVQEPYRLDLNVTWLRALANRTVLLVHPFNASIRAQLARGPRAIWGNWSDTLFPPSMKLKIVVPPVSFAGQDEFKDWRSALVALIKRVLVVFLSNKRDGGSLSVSPREAGADARDLVKEGHADGALRGVRM